MKTSILAAILLAGCGGGPDADVISRRGVQSFFGEAHETGMTAELADQMENYLSNGLTAYGYAPYETDNSISGLRVQWVTSPFFCETSSTGLCDGESYLVGHAFKVNQSNTFKCPWLSAYIHEELHHIQYARGIETDYKHTRPEWKLIDDRQNYCD